MRQMQLMAQGGERRTIHIYRFVRYLLLDVLIGVGSVILLVKGTMIEQSGRVGLSRHKDTPMCGYADHAMPLLLLLLFGHV